MREILFRGKTDKGEWVEGYVFEMHILGDKTTYISTKPFMLCNDGDFDYEPFAVDTETVGQYTGLIDKNGTKIFEGDIVMFGFSPCVVKYDLTNSRYMFYDRGIYLKNGFNVDTMKTKEVVGNITDNPELLGGD